MMHKGEVTIRLARNSNHFVGNGSLDLDMMAYIFEVFKGSVLERDEDHSEESQGGEYEMAEVTLLVLLLFIYMCVLNYMIDFPFL